jgi:hypothetical protein
VETRSHVDQLSVISDAISNAIGYAKFYSRSHDAVIRVYDAAGNVIETHEHAGEFVVRARRRSENDSAS